MLLNVRLMEQVGAYMWQFLPQTTMVICAGITRIDTKLTSHSVLPELSVEAVKKFYL